MKVISSKYLNKKFLTNIFLIILFIFIIIVYRRSIVLKEVVYILLFSFIFSYTLKPIYSMILKKTMINKRIVAATLILLVVTISVSFILFLIPRLFTESLNIEFIVNSIEKFIEGISLKFKFTQYKIFSVINEQITYKINSIIMDYSSKVVDALISFSEDILSLAVVPVVSYYFLADGELIGNRIMLLFSSDKRKIIRSFARDIDRVLGKYILAQLLLCLIIGVMTFISLIPLKIQFPLLLSLLNAVFNIIPYFGAILGALPIIFVALMDSTTKAIWAVVICFILQQVEGNILSPQITSNSVSMHPLIVIILLLIGDKIGGFMGMILAIPIGVVIKVIYEDINYNLF